MKLNGPEIEFMLIGSGVIDALFNMTRSKLISIKSISLSSLPSTVLFVTPNYLEYASFDKIKDKISFSELNSISV